MSFKRARARRLARLRHPSSYEPDDQFFQAFRAGWFHSRMASGAWGNYKHDEFAEQRIWSEYVAWLCEKPK